MQLAPCLVSDNSEEINFILSLQFVAVIVFWSIFLSFKIGNRDVSSVTVIYRHVRPVALTGDTINHLFHVVSTYQLMLSAANAK